MIAWRAARPHAGLEECLAAFAGRTLAPDLQIYTNANALARTMYAPFYPDLVLVFEADALPSPEAGKRAYLRDRYEDLIVGMGIIVEREPPRPHADPASALAPHRWFVKLWIPFETMCKAAEELMLRMPFVPAASVAAGLEAAGVPYKATQPFERDLLEEFVGGKAAGGREWEVQMRFWEGGWRALAGAYLVEHLTIRDYSPDRPKARLNRLLGDGVYTDFYPPHSGPINGQGPGSSSNGLSFLPPPPDDPEAPPPSAPSTVLVPPNPRVDLHRDWARVKLMWRKGWRQPLDDVRKYFGERIAWYFAWAGFYTLLLIPLSAFAFVVFIYGLVTAATGGAFSVDFAQANLTEVGTVIVTGFAVTFDNALTPWYGIALCAWATIAFEYWKRRTSALSFAWDTGDFKHSEVTRPEWIGTNTRRSTVTGRFEQYAPDGVQQGLRTLSWCLVGLSIGVVVLAICGFIAFQAWAIRSLADYPFAGTILPALLSLVSIVVLDGLYKKLVVPWLLQIENWKKESEYENSYIIKVFLFDFVNLYGSLFYIGVVKPWVSLTGVFNRDDWKDTCAFNSCMAELMIQLVVIFLARQWLNSLVEWVLPRLKTWWNERKGKVVRDDDVVEDATRGQYISDAGRIKYERADLWADYTKIIAQYGYISLFSVAFPLAAPLALFNNLIEIRSDASRLVLICQRPFFRRAKDQGVYDSVLSVISYMSVMFNALIISFSSTAVKVSYLDRYGPQNALAAQFGFALAFTGVVLVVSKAAELVIPDVSKETKTAMEREEYLVGTKVGFRLGASG
ncbi:calcium-activated chloride channel-domain-containing protein [Hyaloraphidium curvatum]|nr:calcium-activated chloride channel-domain-containing protein [Hyaloraphidium curvatum]